VNLNDRYIVVTGAAAGLGAAFAQGVAQAGAAHVLIADRDRAESEKRTIELLSAGYSASFAEVDLADPASIEAFAAALPEHMPRVDGLINNAAVATAIGGKYHDEIDIETWDRVMSVNVRGTWLVTRALAPILRASARGGRIVNMASDTALWGATRLLHYVASKGAVISMTYALSRELGPGGITVNALAPGLVESPSTEYVPQDRRDWYTGGSALGRLGQPEDIVGAAVFLLSDAAGFITGQVIPVNGGLVHP
jgi:NAD(P)-dependent dehydrogenase (short-subunit alcohol dehydrogenase family)